MLWIWQSVLLSPARLNTCQALRTLWRTLSPNAQTQPTRQAGPRHSFLQMPPCNTHQHATPLGGLPGTRPAVPRQRLTGARRIEVRQKGQPGIENRCQGDNFRHPLSHMSAGSSRIRSLDRESTTVTLLPTVFVTAGVWEGLVGFVQLCVVC